MPFVPATPPYPPPGHVQKIQQNPAKVGPYWNSWLKDQNSRPEPLESVEAHHDITYTFFLDLSPLNYRDLNIHTVGSVPVDPTFGSKIQELIDRGQSKIFLRIRPILIGTGLNLVTDTNEVNKSRTFNLERLKQWFLGFCPNNGINLSNSITCAL
jgi:hypothetical protein